MTYRDEDNKQLLLEFIAWLARVGFTNSPDPALQKRYVDAYLKEQATAREWGKNG